MSLAVIAGGAGCTDASADDDPQRLLASAQLFGDEGPAADVRVDRYELAFIVAGESGDVAIGRGFTEDADGGPIVTDADGRFQIASEDLALSYQWERDEQVCGDVCVSYISVCDEVTEEVCLDVCTGEDCWDECWDDCSVECWDEEVCDEYGCWTETYCEEYCVEQCDTVCETVSYACNCYLDTYEICGDECVQTVQECEWVTRTYTSAATLDQVVDTQATIWMPDGAADSPGTGLSGEPLEARQHQGCNPAGECGALDLWIQKDRFVLPALTP